MLKFKKIKNNLIHSTAIINWKKVIIGNGNIIGPYVVIGNSAQHPKLKSNGIIHIGNNNVFNEYCNIHLPTNNKKKTKIGNDNYFMNSTTIDHDCELENNIILSSNVTLGGNVYIMNNAQLGIKSSIHQNQVIGSYSMVGMHSFITKKLNVIPGFIFYGKPAKKVKKNLISLKRNKINMDIIKKETKRFKDLIKLRK
jgi:UDP-N-acetylglucosamine acyltransferase